MQSAHESAARWLKLDELCDRFEAACLAGTQPRVEEYLNDVPVERRDATLRELLKLDAHYRQQLHDRPNVAEYRLRFPEIDSLWLQTMLMPRSSRALLESPGTMSAREPFFVDPTVLPSIPGYEVLELIGRGGMGVVYKARQVNLNRLVALKMVLAGDLAGPETLARFRAEARAVAQLQHPNLVQIYEVGEHYSRPYLAFEYVAGGGLDQRLCGEPQTPSAAALLIRTLAHAIQFAHTRGIVHRDLKPANILLASSERIPTNQSRTSILPHGSISEAEPPVQLPEGRPSSSVDNPTLSGSELARVYGFPKISDFGLAKDLESDSQQTGDTRQVDSLLHLELEHTRALVTDLPDSAPDRLQSAKTLTALARRQVESGEKSSASHWYPEAIAEFKRLQDDAQDQTKYREAIIKLMNEYSRLGRDSAHETSMIALWEDWLRRAPKDAVGLNTLAWWLSIATDQKLRDPVRAVELARQAVALNPTVAAFRNTLGTALYRADMLTEARIELEKSLELASTAPAMDWYLLAAIAHRDGRTEEARELFDRAEADHQKNHPLDEDHAVIAAEVLSLLR